MKQFAFLTALLATLFMLGSAEMHAAEVAGRFTEVEGRVDVLKGGKLPAVPAKITAQCQGKFAD